MGRVEGVDYTPEGIEDIRENVIQIRDIAIEQDHLEWAVLFSHVIAYLGDYKEILNDDSTSEQST